MPRVGDSELRVSMRPSNLFHSRSLYIEVTEGLTGDRVGKTNRFHCFCLLLMIWIISVIYLKFYLFV